MSNGNNSDMGRDIRPDGIHEKAPPVEKAIITTTIAAGRAEIIRVQCISGNCTSGSLTPNDRYNNAAKSHFGQRQCGYKNNSEYRDWKDSVGRVRSTAHQRNVLSVKWGGLT